MILRLWPEHHNDTVLRNELLQAMQAYPNTFEEVWFCAEFETLSMEAHRKSAEAMAVAAEKMREIGVTPSIQGITLGHGDNFESGSEELIPTAWGTIIDASGAVTRSGHCPRQPGFHEYLKEVYALYAQMCQPAVVWLDERPSGDQPLACPAALFLRHLHPRTSMRSMAGTGAGRACRGTGGKR